MIKLTDLLFYKTISISWFDDSKLARVSSLFALFSTIESIREEVSQFCTYTQDLSGERIH